METLKTTKYLKFDIVKDTGKTKLIFIINIHHDEVIGEIRWFSRWRQYCFSPNNNTIWNTECLNDVNAVIKQLMDERKTKPKPRIKTVGVIAFNIEDFRNWRREKKHRPYTHQDTERKYVYRNKRYVCLTHKMDSLGYTFDEIIDTPRACMNKEYNEILEFAKNALIYGGVWRSALKVVFRKKQDDKYLC
jgi:hypothetical protein